MSAISPPVKPLEVRSVHVSSNYAFTPDVLTSASTAYLIRVEHHSDAPYHEEGNFNLFSGGVRMLATFTIIPLGEGESISAMVAKVVGKVHASGLDYKLNSMGTVVEGDWDEVMELIKSCHQLMRRKSSRVYTSITIDDRKGAKQRLAGKVESVKKKIKHEIKT
jgi:uncharacterized protein (TIGR00106 family)